MKCSKPVPASPIDRKPSSQRASATSANCGSSAIVDAASVSARACCSAVTPGTPEKSIGAVGSHGRGHAAASRRRRRGRRLGRDRWSCSVVAVASSVWAWSPRRGVVGVARRRGVRAAARGRRVVSSWLWTSVAPAIIATTVIGADGDGGDAEAGSRASPSNPWRGRRWRRPPPPRPTRRTRCRRTAVTRPRSRPSIQEIPQILVMQPGGDGAAVDDHRRDRGDPAAADEQHQPDDELGDGRGDEQARQRRVLGVDAGRRGVDRAGTDRCQPGELRWPTIHRVRRLCERPHPPNHPGARCSFAVLPCRPRAAIACAPSVRIDGGQNAAADARGTRRCPRGTRRSSSPRRAGGGRRRARRRRRGAAGRRRSGVSSCAGRCGPTDVARSAA